MSESKADRSIAQRTGTRRSRAQQVNDRSTRAPASRRPTPKPKKGERSMREQLDALKLKPKQPAPPAVPTTLVEHDDPDALEPVEATKTLPAVTEDPEYPSPPKDPWWTAEREKAYQMTLAGMPQAQVAAQLGHHRHTIARWGEDKRFVERLQEDNESRFHSMRQRRVMQTTRLTDKAYGLAEKMLKSADENPKDLNSRLAARDWLSEFREQSRREDEIFGLDKQRVDVNIHGNVQHNHKGKVGVDLSFKEFLQGSLKRMGVDVEAEEIDAKRADDALVAITEKALLEGTFLEEMVEREKEQMALVPAKAS